MERIEGLCKKLKRYPHEEARAVALRFAEDFMRLRRDLRDYERLTAAMERIQLVRSEHTRDLSRMNNSLYEFLLPTEARPAQDNVINHAVIKADVRGSTRITKDLLARGLNPATLFSLNFYEPVKRILERYGAAKVFIEGDAMVLAIFETESNRSHQRAVSKACALARQILAISAAYNDRPDNGDLPRLELGVGVAFQGSAPTYWVDSDSRIMISRALNLSDRLSSCSKVARRMLGDKASLFRLFVFQAGVEGRRRGRGRRIPDSFQPEWRGVERRRFRQAAGRDIPAIRRSGVRNALGPRANHILHRPRADRRRPRTHPAPPRLCPPNAGRRSYRSCQAIAPITKSAPIPASSRWWKLCS